MGEHDESKHRVKVVDESGQVVGEYDDYNRASARKAMASVMARLLRSRESGVIRMEDCGEVFTVEVRKIEPMQSARLGVEAKEIRTSTKFGDICPESETVSAGPNLLDKQVARELYALIEDSCGLDYDSTLTVEDLENIATLAGRFAETGKTVLKRVFEARTKALAATETKAPGR